MGSLLNAILSLATAGVMLTSGALKEAAPQNDLDGLFLANRQWKLSAAYIPEVRKAEVGGQVRNMTPEAAAALEEMFAACKAETGVTLLSVSGYRSYNTQRSIYQRRLKRMNGNEKRADDYVARPGASEHQLGLAMDVGQKGKDNGLSSSFGKTKGGKWVKENCWRFGFVLRYQEGWEKVTGYRFEPWHIRYVGKEHAARLHENPMPLETYLKDYRTENLILILTRTTETGE